MRSIFLKIWVLSFFMYGLTGSLGYAQSINVEVELSSRQIALGSSAQLLVTVNGSQDVAPIDFPKIDGFDVKYLGPSTRVSIVNGKYSTSKTLAYSLFPLKEGRFEIPSFNVAVAGRTFTTEPIPLEVKESVEPAPSPAPGQPTSLKDKIFLVLEVPKQEVYLNEKLTVKVLLYVAGLSVRDVQYPKLDSIGFTIGEYDQPQQYQKVINGIRHEVVEFKTDIYPTRTGELRLGPARTECNIIVRSSEGPARFGSRSSVFDDDFFNSFFDRGEKRPIVLESEAPTIVVQPLPEEGRPEGFSGAVGDFDFNVAVGPTEVKEGDPITLRLTVIGEGNLAAVEMPTLPAESGFKLYDPQILEKDNIKKSDQVIIPKSDAIKEVPAIAFSYFDPQSRKYQTVKQGPFPIKVTQLEKGDEFRVVGLEGDTRPAEPETLGQDIVFIKASPGKLKAIGQAAHKSFPFYAVVCLAAVLWLGGFVYYKRTYRIRTDSVYARRLMAPRQARQGMAIAKKLMVAGKKEAFYDAVFKTAQRYLGNKLHLSSGAVTLENVRDHLSNKNVDRNVIDDIRTVYDECDMVRYASADIDQERMNGSYQRLARVIDHLERFLK